MTRIRRSSVMWEAEHGIRYAIIAVLIIGFCQRRWRAVVNAIITIAATYLPGVIEDHYDVEFLPWQRVYAATAMFTHAAGMLGPYEDEDTWWWWDNLTHTHSATLLAGLVHAAARRRSRDPRPRVLAAVVCLGILWEFTEYTIHTAANRFGFEPVLVPFGKKDTLFDLCFNTLGALLVLAFGDRFLRNFIQRSD